MTPHQWIENVVAQYRQNRLDSQGLAQEADKIANLVDSFSKQLSALTPPSNNSESKELADLSKLCFETFSSAVEKLRSVAAGNPSDQLDQALVLSQDANLLVQQVIQKTAS
jgi:uncharacterized protein Yka (UPF0111/DUF47 family)